jgi:hypothetical protein
MNGLTMNDERFNYERKGTPQYKTSKNRFLATFIVKQFIVHRFFLLLL